MTGLITDPGFDRNRTEEYKLSIQVSLDGFSFSIVHAQKKQLLALQMLPVNLSSSKFLGRHFRDWVKKHKVLHDKFHSTQIIYSPENLTFVPSAFYEYAHQETLAALAFGSPNGDLLTENFLPNASGNLVFPVLKNLQDELKQLFPEQKLIHPVTLLDNELDKLSDKKDTTMALYFGKKQFSLILYANSQLKLVNSYSYASAGDVVYFSVTAMKKLKLVPEKTTLFMAGEITQKGEIHNSLQAIMSRTIFFIPEVHYNVQIFKEPLHRFIVLF